MTISAMIHHDTPRTPSWDDGGPSHAERAARTAALFDAARATDDPERRADLLGQVVVLNHRVAQAVARRYRGRGVPDDDLEQAACEGLVKASQHFDPTLGHDFLSYAVPSIRGEVQRWFRDHSWTIRPPRRLQQLQWHLNRTVAALALELDRQPVAAEVCERMGIEPEELREVEASFGCFRLASLDHHAEVRTRDLDTHRDSGRDDSWGLRPAEDRADLVPALRRLKPRDRQIVLLRFYEDRTQQEIADELGITQMQVSRLLTRILRDVRHDLTGS